MISYIFRSNVTNDTRKNLTLTTVHKTNIEFIMVNAKTLKQSEEYLKNQKKWGK